MLEAREREATVQRKSAQQQSEKERVAERIRHEWEAEREARSHAARENLRQQRLRAEALKQNTPTTTADSTLRVGCTFKPLVHSI